MIIKELISNLGILITSIFLYTQLTRKSAVNLQSSLKRKLAAGALAGLLSNVLMQYSMSFGSTIIDLRHIPILLVAYYGGPIPAFTAMLLVIGGRFLIGFNISSIFALLLIVSITLSVLLIFRSTWKRRTKIFWALTVSNIIFTVIITFLLNDLRSLPALISVYWSISYAAGFAAFSTVDYLRKNQALMERFKAEATTDGLTGLHNVRKFDQVFNDLCLKAETKQERMALLFIDIDHFKQVNDTYGHNEGDLVLSELSQVLKRTVRSFDIVSRNGGEEFTVILPDCSLSKAKNISERIRQEVEKNTFILSSNEKINVTVSVGLASYRETTSEPKKLLQDADQALYKAKRTGRNKVCTADSLLRAESVIHRHISK
ncbi:diguanylate cyclase [Jeotgalibacillus alimentarius]|uniref:Diguanylate cyclase n=1 Tax=Jeotgalibacillus alimentarius TaxID=135826 RepID=A0A0C2VFF6_9BACL|nr:diguanylate cyclase [Jeotgalibacillus alimentarius]KIL42753.1 diguanylate cyclase [Jeotgalibacillus alimentarius]